MRTTTLWIVSALAALVALGVVVQIYLIAAYIFGADALDAHEAVGSAVHGIEVLAFLVAIPAFWKDWRSIGLVFLLPLIGTIQVAFAGGDDWVGGLHGLLALAVIAIAGFVHVKAMRAAKALGSAATA